jgi:hypothetical protein
VAFQHAVQMGCRILDVVMPVLAGPAFRSQYATAVNIPEISEGKRVMRLGIFGPLVVDPQKPFAIFGKTVETDIFAFLQGRRVMLAPVIALVEYESSFIDERLACSYARRLRVAAGEVLLFSSVLPRPAMP